MMSLLSRSTGRRTSGLPSPLAPRSAGACVPASRDVPYNRGPDEPGESNWQTLPDIDRHSILRIGRIDLGQLTAAREPVVPIQRHWLGAPLLLETERSRVGGGPAEVEDLVTRLTRVFQSAPVHQHVRREPVGLSEGRSPGD